MHGRKNMVDCMSLRIPGLLGPMKIIFTGCLTQPIFDIKLSILMVFLTVIHIQLRVIFIFMSLL